MLAVLRMCATIEFLNEFSLQWQHVEFLCIQMIQNLNCQLSEVQKEFFHVVRCSRHFVYWVATTICNVANAQL